MLCELLRVRPERAEVGELLAQAVELGAGERAPISALGKGGDERTRAIGIRVATAEVGEVIEDVLAAGGRDLVDRVEERGDDRVALAHALERREEFERRLVEAQLGYQRVGDVGGEQHAQGVGLLEQRQPLDAPRNDRLRLTRRRRRWLGHSQIAAATRERH